jgi:hypothetical protein
VLAPLSPCTSTSQSQFTRGSVYVPGAHLRSLATMKWLSSSTTPATPDEMSLPRARHSEVGL